METDDRTMSKLEARAKIMELLKWYKGLEDHDVEMAKFVIAQGGQPDESLANRMKFGRYFPMKDLKETIASAMEMKMVDWNSETKSELVGVHDCFNGYCWIGRSKKATYKTIGFTQKDNATIEKVIGRMADQGFIKVSKSGNGFLVLKVEG